MIIREGTSEGSRCLLVNRETGDIYSRVKWFDTETKEAEVYVVVQEFSEYEQRAEVVTRLGLSNPITIKEIKCGRIAVHSGGGVATVRVSLPNAIALDRFTMEEMR